MKKLTIDFVIPEVEAQDVLLHSTIHAFISDFHPKRRIPFPLSIQHKIQKFKISERSERRERHGSVVPAESRSETKNEL